MPVVLRFRQQSVETSCKKTSSHSALGIRIKDGDTVIVRGPVLPDGFNSQPGQDTWLTKAWAAARRGEEVVWFVTPHIMK